MYPASRRAERWEEMCQKYQFLPRLCSPRCWMATHPRSLCISCFLIFSCLFQGKPFFLTFFVSNEIKLHWTDTENVSAFLDKHVGTLVSPPASPQRGKDLGPYASYDFAIDGSGWKQSSSDIVLAGLGWVSVTGAGPCTIRVTVPNGTLVTQRQPLLPFESHTSSAKFSGGRIVKTSRKQDKSQSSYGWRA